MSGSPFRAIVRYRHVYLMFLPVAAFYIVFHYVPMYGVVIAFKDFNILSGILGSEWSGTRHFAAFLRDEYFWRVARNTVVISVSMLVFSFPVPIVLALLLNEVKAIGFKRTVQTIMYLPHFVSWVIVGGIIFNFLSYNYGMVNRILERLGGEKILFMGRPDLFRPILVLSHIWKESGWSSIIYIAAIAQINPELYEAATIDGARKLQQVRHVTLPGIAPTVTILFILALSNILNADFGQVFVLYNPMVYDVGDIIDTYVYRAGLLQLRYSYAAAVGVTKSVIGLALILSADRFFKRVAGTGII